MRGLGILKNIPVSDTKLTFGPPPSRFHSKFTYYGKLMHSKDYWNMQVRVSGKYVKL